MKHLDVVANRVAALVTAMDNDMTGKPSDVAQAVALQAGVKMLGFIVIEIAALREALVSPRQDDAE